MTDVFIDVFMYLFLGLTVRLYGYGRVCWDEKRAYTKGAAGSVELKNVEVYLDQSISLLKKGILKNLFNQLQTLDGMYDP